jgi:DNA-binding NarL/FixJ family response regulator
MNHVRRDEGPTRLTAHKSVAAHDLQDLLTTGERAVVVLVGYGLSNLHIAGRLGISVRTVESHLSHVYTKTGIGSRVSLAITTSAVRAA